jgi:hypothetical protein
MAYRDDVTALSARHDALAAEVAQKTRELEESRRLLEHARARTRLPVLDQIRVASPCTADWTQMTGDERTRHCGECQKDVYNLSGMTREEAEALVIEHNGDLCVRYYQRHDGTILLADCTVGVAHKRRHRRTAARAAALVAGGLAATGAMASHVTMGTMARPDEPPCIESRAELPYTMGKFERSVPPSADPAVPAEEPVDDAVNPAPPSMHLPDPLPARHTPQQPHRTPPRPMPPRPEIDHAEMMGKMVIPADRLR